MCWFQIWSPFFSTMCIQPATQRFSIELFNAILRYMLHFYSIRVLSILVVHTCNWYYWNRLIETFKMNTNNLYPKWIFIICYLLFWTSKLKNLSIREQRKVSKRVNFWIFQEKTPWSNAYVSQIKYSAQFLGICYIFSLLLAHSLTIVNAKIRNSRCAIFLHALKVWAGNFK